MRIQEIARKLEGLQTVDSIARILHVRKRTAINHAWRLRKGGYLKNAPGGMVRVYKISPVVKKREGYSLYEILNEHTKVKIAAREDYIIHADKKPSVEEILARAVASQRFRVVLAALGLFNKVRDWGKVRYFARKYREERKIGALYDLARRMMRVRRMDERTRKGLLQAGGDKYIIKNIRTKDFGDIRRRWGVHIPFSKADMEAYRT